MQTYNDYRNDTGLGFGFDTIRGGMRRAADCGGSEIKYMASADQQQAIEDDLDSDDQCGGDDDGPEGSDSGLVQFWARAERVIRRHAAKIISA